MKCLLAPLGSHMVLWRSRSCVLFPYGGLTACIWVCLYVLQEDAWKVAVWKIKTFEGGYNVSCEAVWFCFFEIIDLSTFQIEEGLYFSIIQFLFIKEAEP